MKGYAPSILVVYATALEYCTAQQPSNFHCQLQLRPRAVFNVYLIKPWVNLYILYIYIYIFFFSYIGHELLQLENIGTVVDELMNVRQKAYDLGLELKIPEEILDTIREQAPKRQLISVIEHFLQQDTPCRPTWRAIVKALQSPRVQHPLPAQRIIEKYCTDVEGKNIIFTLSFHFVAHNLPSILYCQRAA